MRDQRPASLPRAMSAAAALAAAVLISSPLHAQVPAGFETAWQDIEARFTASVEEEGIVGASLWFLHDGEVIRQEMRGFADLASEREIDRNTIFHWASITKTFTGIAIMQLRDRGLLTLDDALVSHLPSLRRVHNPYGPMENVTIRHVMSHSSGFRNPTWPWGGGEPWHPHEPTEWDQLVAMMPYTEILFEPGSRYGYSNPGVIFLGRIIERLSGDDYEVYIDKNILDPLGMHRSYFDVTPYHLRPHRSNSYRVSEGDTVANGFDFDTGITVSNGGLNAPLPDMVRYLSFLTGALEGPAAEGVLSRASLEEMWQPVVPLGADAWSRRAGPARAENPWDASMGLSFFVYDRDLRILGHTGSQRSFISFIYFDPASGAAALASFNTEGDPRPQTGAVLEELRMQLFEEVFPLFH